MNFIKLAENVDVSPIIDEITQANHLFGSLPIRTQFEQSPHREVEDILLRGPEIKEDSTLLELYHEIQCVTYDNMKLFPALYQSVLDLMRAVNGEQLGRVIITKLPSGGQIYQHADEGDAADAYDRFHIVINGALGNRFIINREEQQMITGEVWWINNHDEHSVVNNSDEDRIHIVCDIMVWK